MIDLEALKAYNLKITHPDKPLYPKVGIDKLTYITYLAQVSPYLLKYSSHRLLTCIRYPHGVGDLSFYQKNKPDYSPNWVKTFLWHDKDYILLEDIQTLVWLGNQGTLEFHVAFNKIDEPDNPDCLVLDLDPSEGQTFKQVSQVALYVRDILQQMGLEGYPKTSGATGIQIYIPIEPIYAYEEARRVNYFIGDYLVKKYPKEITLERSIERRKGKLYFDYLQMWRGKSMICAYSPRAKENGTVSAPITWEEIQQGISPLDFTIKNMIRRIEKVGDLFVSTIEKKQKLDSILDFLSKQGY